MKFTIYALFVANAAPALLEKDADCHAAEHNCDFKNDLACIGPLEEFGNPPPPEGDGPLYHLCVPSTHCSGFDSYTPEQGIAQGKLLVKTVDEP